MTRQWYLSSEATKGMGILSVCADALFALEQSQMPSTDRAVKDAEIESSIEKCKSLLTALRKAARSQVSTTATVDALSFQLIDHLRRRTTTSASDLATLLSKAEVDLEKRNFNQEIIRLLKLIGEEGSIIAERSLEGLRTPS
jgi:hypothetical protein